MHNVIEALYLLGVWSKFVEEPNVLCWNDTDNQVSPQLSLFCQCVTYNPIPNIMGSLVFVTLGRIVTLTMHAWGVVSLCV